jgi:hypothetical protein
VPFLPWARGTTSDGGEFSYNAFELATLGIDARILAYLLLGVGALATVIGLLAMAGSTRVILGATVASGMALVLTMVVIASFGFAQILGLPNLLSADAHHSFPPALVVLGVSTGLMLAGSVLGLRNERGARSWMQGSRFDSPA